MFRHMQETSRSSWASTVAYDRGGNKSSARGSCAQCHRRLVATEAIRVWRSNIVGEAFGGIRGAAEHDRHLDASSPLEDFHRDFVGMTPHLEVDAGLLELQIAQ